MTRHPLVNVISVDMVAPRTLSIEFSDGAHVTRDLTPLLWGPMFEVLREDPAEFARVSVEPVAKVICWPNGADMDSEVLRYDDLWDEVIHERSRS